MDPGYWSLKSYKSYTYHFTVYVSLFSQYSTCFSGVNRILCCSSVNTRTLMVYNTHLHNRRREISQLIILLLGCDTVSLLNEFCVYDNCFLLLMFSFFSKHTTFSCTGFSDKYHIFGIYIYRFSTKQISVHSDCSMCWYWFTSGVAH